MEEKGSAVGVSLLGLSFVLCEDVSILIVIIFVRLFGARLLWSVVQEVSIGSEEIIGEVV